MIHNYPKMIENSLRFSMFAHYFKNKFNYFNISSIILYISPIILNKSPLIRNKR